MYSAMLRVLKSYTFNFQLTTPGRRIVFSSYPATIGSNDDFYVTSAGLWVSETTYVTLAVCSVPWVGWTRRIRCCLCRAGFGG